MTRVLITGGHGYIGSLLTRHLRAQDIDVEVSDPTVKNFGTRDMTRHYQHFRCPQLNTYSHIIHLAAHSSVAACEADPSGAIDNNILNTIRLGRQLSEQTLIFASSGSVLDANTTRLYDTTKSTAEQVLPYVHRDTHILRFGTVCGVSPVMREDLILNGMVRDAVRTKVVTVRNPHAWRPVLFFPDLCAAVDDIIAGHADPGVRDLASYQARIGGWADMVAKITGAEIVDDGLTPHYDFKMAVVPKSLTSPEKVINELVGYWRARS